MRDEKGEPILENGKRQLEFVAVQRADTNQWAIPGVSAVTHCFICFLLWNIYQVHGGARKQSLHVFFQGSEIKKKTEEMRML